MAGFVEPGESIEEAVARELMEEAGIAVRDVRYVASQPWPFPGQLMIACIASAESDALTLDSNELDDAFWATRAEVEAALAGDPPPVERPLDLLAAHGVAQVAVEREQTAVGTERLGAGEQGVEQGRRGQVGSDPHSDVGTEPSLDAAGHGRLGHHQRPGHESTRAKSRAARAVPRTEPETLERVPVARGW